VIAAGIKIAVTSLNSVYAVLLCFTRIAFDFYYQNLIRKSYTI